MERSGCEGVVVKAGVRVEVGGVLGWSFGSWN